jgi:hypothetical protein
MWNKVFQEHALLVFLSFQNFPSLVMNPCSLIGYPKFTIVNHHVIFGCRAPSWTHVQMNQRATLWTQSPKQIIAPLCGPGHPNKPMNSSIGMQLRTDLPNLGETLMLMRPNIIGHFIFKQAPLHVHMLRHQIGQLGCHRIS